jgi:hypothetical protein
VSDGPSERAGGSGGVIDMQRIEVAGEAGKKHDVGFGHRAAGAFPFIADDQVVE